MKTLHQYILTMFLLCTLFLLNASAKDATQFGLPDGAIARLGKGSIGDISISPDGKQLAVASSIGVWLYDTQSGDEIALLTGHKTTVRAVAFSPDGKTIASGSGLGRVKSLRLWDTKTSKNTVLYSGGSGDFRTLDFSPDGNTLVSGDNDGNVILWDTNTGERKQNLAGYTSQVISVVFSPDGKTVAAGALDSTILSWNVDDGQIKHQHNGHTDWVITLAFSPDGATLASGSQDGSIRLWDTDTGQQKVILTKQKNEILTVTFSPDGSLLACGIQLGRKIEFLDVSTGKVEQTIQIPKGGVSRVLYSPEKNTLVSMGLGGRIYFWDLVTGTNILNIDGHTHNARAIAYSIDGKTLASTYGYGIDLWDVDTLSHKETLKVKVNQNGFAYIFSLAFSPDYRTIASTHGNGIINLLDYITGEQKHQLEGPTEGIRSIAFSSDGMLAGAGNDHTIRIWNTENGEQIHELVEKAEKVISVAFSPDNLTLASGYSKGVVRLWDVTTGDQKFTIPKTGNGFSIAYSPNGILLATTGRSIQLWHAKTGENVLTLDHNPMKNMGEKMQLAAGDPEKMIEIHENMMDQAQKLVFSPDGNTLAVLRENGLIRLWDIETQKVIHTYTGHKSVFYRVRSIAFSPDGTTLASGRRDGTILLWDVTNTETEN